MSNTMMMQMRTGDVARLTGFLAAYTMKDQYFGHSRLGAATVAARSHQAALLVSRVVGDLYSQDGTKHAKALNNLRAAAEQLGAQLTESPAGVAFYWPNANIEWMVAA